MRKIDLSKSNGTLQKHLEKAMAHQNYRNAMLESFRENWSTLKDVTIPELRKSFLITGKGCKHLSAEEYADLAVKTFEEVRAMR